MNDFVLVTSMNHRLFMARHQRVLDSFTRHYPHQRILLFHENSFDAQNHRGTVQITHPSISSFDLFDTNPWLAPFLRDSPFGRCAEIGQKNRRFQNSADYWNRNSIYWFRKVAALHTSLDLARTEFLIWADADVLFKSRRLDADVGRHSGSFDACAITRDIPGLATDSGFVIFNLRADGPRLIRALLDAYLGGTAFLLPRWDDGFVLDHVSRSSNFRVGPLTKRMGSPIDIHRYIKHHKGPLISLRDRHRGI
ncbi:MAG: hypothetical protein IT577_01720 [Verrucomicrobiae bacterium]|nr:hypothetical protein [Verrucomicrobiae bacterium]